MKLNKRCLSVIVACLIATTLAIPASAANSAVGTTEIIQFNSGNSITITDCIENPYYGPTDSYQYGARIVNLPSKIQLNGKNMKFNRVAAYEKGSFTVRVDSNSGSKNLDINYNIKPWEITYPIDYYNKSIVDLPIYGLYVVEIQNGDQIIKMWVQASPAPKSQAYPTPSTVKVDGKAIPFDAYNINDNNYFKLRDVAKVLDGTGKQFNVVWDGAKNSIMIQPNKPYQSVGGELATGSKTVKDAAPTTSSVYVEDTLANFTAYNIKDNNYFKLRDIAEKLNFGVTWDGASNTVYIDTTTGYTP